MKSFDQLISVRSCCNVYTNRGNDRFWLASFSCCQNKSNNWSLLSFTGIAVSGLILRLKAKELSSDPDFKASLGWYQRWKKHHSISLRTKTTLAQRLPQDLEEKTIQFHRFVITLRQRYGHSLSRLFNMDETPMRFELPLSRTLEFSGSRTVQWSLAAPRRGTLQSLAVAADGKKLPPSVIFKGVCTPKDLAVPDTVQVLFHKKGWMDEKGRNLSHFYFIAHW